MYCICWLNSILYWIFQMLYTTWHPLLFRNNLCLILNIFTWFGYNGIGHSDQISNFDIRPSMNIFKQIIVCNIAFTQYRCIKITYCFIYSVNQENWTSQKLRGNFKSKQASQIRQMKCWLTDLMNDAHTNLNTAWIHVSNGANYSYLDIINFRLGLLLCDELIVNNIYLRNVVHSKLNMFRVLSLNNMYQLVPPFGNLQEQVNTPHRRIVF